LLSLSYLTVHGYIDQTLVSEFITRSVEFLNKWNRLSVL